MCEVKAIYIEPRYPVQQNMYSKATNTSIYPYKGNRGGTVVKVLCYKSEGLWLDPSWCLWKFSDRTIALGSNHPLI